MQSNRYSTEISSPSAWSRVKSAASFDAVSEAWLSFWAGFTSPSVFSLALIGAVFCLSVGLTLAFLTPAFIAGPLGAYLPSSQIKDQELLATRKALQISTGSGTATRLRKMYVIGNSIMAHTVVSESSMALAVKEATQQDWNVSLFTTPLQGPFDEAALAEHATSRDPGIVVLSVGFERFGVPRSDYLKLCDLHRLGLQSDWSSTMEKPLCGQSETPSGIYAWDHRIFLSQKLGLGYFMRVLLGNYIDQKYDVYLLSFTPTAARREDRRRSWLKVIRRGMLEDQFAEDMLGQTVRNLKARGNLVMFVQTPVSDNLLETQADREAYAAYKKRMGLLARSGGNLYCELDLPGTSDQSFYPDQIHLDDAATQDRARRKLAECVKQLQKEGVHRG